MQPVSESAIPVTPAPDLAAQAPVERQRYATGFANQDASPNGNGNGSASAYAETGRNGAADDAPVLRREPAPRQEPALRPQQAQREQSPRAEAVRNEAAPVRGLPKVQRFDLPVSELVQVAQGSGLQWVNSDVGKIAAVQAAIAAESKPIHIPRERAPAVAVDDAPLVLVETKRDLREMKLPFEQSGTP